MTNHPFGDHWAAYLDKGFSPLPAALDGKAVFLKGVIGEHGVVTEDKCLEWQDLYGARNLGISGKIQGREDISLLILDDDNNSTEVLESLEAEHGALPPHPNNTARGAGNPRCKRIFKVRGQRKRKGKYNGIDMICWNQRHAVVEGIHPQLGTPYLWYDNEGQLMDGPPSLEDIPFLPEAWDDFWAAPEKVQATRLLIDESSPEPDSSEQAEGFLNWLDQYDSGPTSLMGLLLEDVDKDPNFGHDDLFVLLVRLVELTNFYERGGKQAYERIKGHWLGRSHKSGDPQTEFNHSLNNALNGHWSGPHALPDFTLNDLMHKWEKEHLSTPITKRLFKEGSKRPLFTAVLEKSKRTGDDPLALLMAVLLHVCNTIPWDVYYKTPKGIDPINLCVVLIGATGTGKSALMSTAEDEFEYAREPDSWRGSVEAASGEGMQDAFYFRDVRYGKNNKKVISEGWRIAGRNPFFSIKEVGSLEARSSRQGSTYREVLLDLYTGSEISRLKASGEGWSVKKNTYRWTCWIGAQPTRTEFFFNPDAIAAGLVGRFLWANVATDSDFDFFAEFEDAPFVVGRPHWEGMDPPYYYPTKELLKEHEREIKKNKRGEGNPLESHTHRNKGRLACVLAASDNRTYMTDGDVELAELLIQASRETYMHCLKEMNNHWAKQQAAKGQFDGVRNHHGTRRSHQMDVEHQAKRLQTKFLSLCGTEALSLKDLRHVYKNNFSVKTREFWSEAIELLVESEDLPSQLKELPKLEEQRLQELETNLNNKKEI